MKLKNISVGDSVRIKKSMCHIEFKAKQVCEVIDTDPNDKHGFDVLIQGKNCLDWVNHKDLKKYIEIEDKPKLKALDQSVFDGLDSKWRFAAVDEDGKAHKFNLKAKPHDDVGEFVFSGSNCSFEYELIGTGYDATNWQNSLIERKELTGSDLCRAMLARGDKYVLCHLSQTSEKSAKDVLGIAIGYDHSGFRVQRHNSWQYAVPINNQGEPLTQSEVGL